MNQGNFTTQLPDGSLLMKTNGKYVFYLNLLNYNSARFFTSQNADEYFVDFISRTLYELNKYNSEESSKQRLLSLMPKSILAQSPDNRRWYFYLENDHYDRNMPYTGQKKDENVSTFINYTIGRLQDDGLLARPAVGPVKKSKFNITEVLTDQPKLYDQLPEKEKQAYNRLKNLIPGSQVVVNLNNGVNAFYLDRNTEYTIQLQNESFIEFINRTIESLYESKRIPEPDMAKDAAERIDQYVSGYTTDEVLSINRLRKLMPESSLIRNKFDKKHIFYIRAEDTWYVGRAYTVQNIEEDVMQFIERTISKLYQDKTIGNTSGDDIAKEDKPEGTHIPKSNITTCPTVSEKLPPIPQPRDLCMPIQIPEGHVRVVLWLGDFDQRITTSFPARVNKKDEFILNLYLEDENNLSSAALLAVNQQETWVCYRTQWERDEEGSYQIAYIK